MTPFVIEMLRWDMNYYGCAAWSVVDDPTEFAIIRRTPEVVYGY